MKKASMFCRRVLGWVGKQATLREQLTRDSPSTVVDITREGKMLCEKRLTGLEKGLRTGGTLRGD